MRFYAHQHQFYCGIDLHTRAMYLCIMDAAGSILVHKNFKASAAVLASTLEPYQNADIAVAAECMFSWYWVADLCRELGITFVLGHALYMKAIHGGKVKNDKVDSKKIAALLRSGMLPQAYVYPHEMRSTRDLLRRRQYFVHHQAELLTHIQLTRHQYNLPAFEKRIDRVSNRQDIKLRFDDDMVRTSIDVDVQLLDTYHQHITAIEQKIAAEVKVHDPEAYQLLRTVPGIGKILALVILYEIHDINRFPSVKNFISYARLIKCAHESGKTRSTGKNAKIGNAHLKWAFGEAACLFLRANKPAQRYHEKLVSKYGKAKSLSIIAQKLGRTVYSMLKQEVPFIAKTFFASLK